MGAVLALGAAVAVAGFVSGVLLFGLSLGVCFLIWIVGALMVNRWKYPSSDAHSGPGPQTNPEN